MGWGWNGATDVEGENTTNGGGPPRYTLISEVPEVLGVIKSQGKTEKMKMTALHEETP